MKKGKHIMDRMTKQSHSPRAWHGLWIAAPIFLLVAVLQPQPAFGQDATWAEDVAPIMYESCVGCHQPEGIGPMSLLDYETTLLPAGWEGLVSFAMTHRGASSPSTSTS